MSLSFLQRHAFGGFITHHVERKVGAHGVHGIFANSPIEESTLLCCLPPFAGISPASARASEVGRLIERRLKPTYSARGNLTSFDVSRDSFLVAAMTAVQRQRGPLSLYIQDAVVEVEDDASMKNAFAHPDEFEHFCEVRELLDKILVEAHADIIMGNGEGKAPTSKEERVELDTIPITLDDLRLANALCESRVVEIPGGEDVFQGPVLMPFVDLINHSDAEPNVYVEVMPIEELGSPKRQEAIKGTHCVVAVAGRDIAPGEELTYHYVEPIGRSVAEKERARARVLWGTRFHFIPPHLRSTN